MKIFTGINEMLVIAVFEFFLVLTAMVWDFFSGYYKAKLRGEERNSYGLRRTVSKFILYAGSICIALGVDCICYVCQFWAFVRLAGLMHVPVVTSLVAVFILITEGRSIWEKADAKQRRQAAKSGRLLGNILNKEALREAVVEAMNENESKNKEYDKKKRDTRVS